MNELINLNYQESSKLGQKIGESKTGIENQIKQQTQLLNQHVNTKHTDTNNILGQKIGETKTEIENQITQHTNTLYSTNTAYDQLLSYKLNCQIKGSLEANSSLDSVW